MIHFKTIKKRLLATALALPFIFTPAVAQLITPPAVEANPALYKISDDDTTIYVLGTIHVLPSHYTWFDGAIRDAFDGADELVLEMVPPDPKTMQGLVQTLAIDPDGKTVRSYFDEDFTDVYEKHLASMDIPANAFDVFEPWMVSVTLSSMQMMAMGLNPESGVESILTEAATGADKPILGLETAEQQLEFFDTLSKETQLYMLKDGIEEWDEGAELIADMLSNWSEGDISGLADLMNEAMEEQPELASTLLTNRNANWADWVKTRLDTPGTVFMAVGAGHIGGEDSLFDILDDDGIEAVRVASE